MTAYKEIPDLTYEEIQRFFKYVMHDPQTGCLLWTGHADVNGYGRFNVRKKSYPAHRLMQAVAGNRVPLDMQLNHTCGNRKCLSHVEICTRSENIRYARDNERGIGHQKISRAVAQEIKNRSAAGEAPKIVSSTMQVPIKRVYAIRAGKNWSDLPSGPIEKRSKGSGSVRERHGRYEASFTHENKYHHCGTHDTRELGLAAIHAKRAELGLA